MVGGGREAGTAASVVGEAGVETAGGGEEGRGRRRDPPIRRARAAKEDSRAPPLGPRQRSPGRAMAATRSTAAVDSCSPPLRRRR